MIVKAFKGKEFESKEEFISFFKSKGLFILDNQENKYRSSVLSE